ncbi:MAG: hypothetical protein A2Y53_03625 [Chloroflexi bacterium RBG_16_47_49]|nr:MAG: hypothetical protein A2Y53_03625 [Chloroflexi bacterium RBG_16_47_49]
MDGKYIAIGTVLVLLIATIVGTIVFGDKIFDDKLTYVSSTEYIATDEGQTVVRLTDFRNNPLSATCYDTILYPNKTNFLTNTAMSADGQANYYHTFTVPAQDGVYTTIVNCTYGSKEITNSKTFHVSLLNSAIQQRFDALNLSIDSHHLEILQAINTTQSNLSQQIQDTRNDIQNAQTNLSNQITSFSSEVQQNFSTVINLINAINTTEGQEHEDIMALLLLINQTTTTTYSELLTFKNETNNNLIIINQTVNDVKNDTTNIIQKIDNLSTQMNESCTNISNQISYLTNLTEHNFNITFQNLTTIRYLIEQLNLTITTEFNDLTNIFLNFNTTINYKLDMINATTNLTEYEVSLILAYLNITLIQLNILPDGNDCWVGGQFLLYAKVTNQFGATQGPSTVGCNTTTTNWGGPYTMTWDGTTDKFKYTHFCDIAGPIGWTIDCNYI